MIALVLVLLAQLGLSDDALSSEPGTMAVLRGLEKIPATTTDFEAPVGEPRAFGALTVLVRYCRTRPPEEPPETFALLEIWDRGLARADDPNLKDETGAWIGDKVFEGWMVASTPSLNPLDHAVYDVWPIACTTASPESDDPAA
ncbi:MAG: DUF2155 domain-containing protein [Maricaulaceae bacterium]